VEFSRAVCYPGTYKLSVEESFQDGTTSDQWTLKAFADGKEIASFSGKGSSTVYTVSVFCAAKARQGFWA
jgi:hypothetical protein